MDIDLRHNHIIMFSYAVYISIIHMYQYMISLSLSLAIFRHFPHTPATILSYHIQCQLNIVMQIYYSLTPSLFRKYRILLTTLRSDTISSTVEGRCPLQSQEGRVSERDSIIPVSNDCKGQTGIIVLRLDCQNFVCRKETPFMSVRLVHRVGFTTYYFTLFFLSCNIIIQFFFSRSSFLCWQLNFDNCMFFYGCFLFSLSSRLLFELPIVHLLCKDFSLFDFVRKNRRLYPLLVKANSVRKVGIIFYLFIE